MKNFTDDLNNLTPFHKSNLRKLADYLIALPIDYQNFDMKRWLFVPYAVIDQNEPSIVHSLMQHHCNTVACAVGHGPLAGIKPIRKHEDWANYANRCFGDLDLAFTWLFNAEWSFTDNSPKGAGKRILHFLEHGVPVDYLDQMRGEAPLCYVE